MFRGSLSSLAKIAISLKTLPGPVCRESRWRKLFCFLLGGYIVGRPHTNVVYFSASEGYNGYVDGY